MSDKGPPTTFAFLLVPNFSMIAFSSAIEPLRMANQLEGSALYAWKVMTYDGGPVSASNGLEITPDGGVTQGTDAEVLLVCGGNGIEYTADPRLPVWLRRQMNEGRALGGVCTGSYLLARAGLLDGYRCTVHWEYIASMRESFPHALLCDELFVVDRDRFTCAGGGAPLDLMLHLVAQGRGRELAAAISEEFVCERIRDDQHPQRIPLRARLGASHPKLLTAVALMEANIEEPMDLDELAYYVSLSRRQLERLFQKYLDCVPTRYYLELRLARARQLLLQTGLSVVEVASACGFVSAPHFSKCYRDFFGIPPREERANRRRAAPSGREETVLERQARRA